MHRRTFLAGVVGGAAFAKPRGGMAFEAVFGAHLPQTLRIPRWPMTSAPNWLELRRYNSSLLQVEGLFARSGIHPLMVESGTDLTYLIPFDSLDQRNRAWTLFDADPEWQRLAGRLGDRFRDNDLPVPRNGRSAPLTIRVEESSRDRYRSRRPPPPSGRRTRPLPPLPSPSDPCRGASEFPPRAAGSRHRRESARAAG